ncbi:substrate-binding periplasmic protein [Lacibacterium aquatile]|uniref:Substrate-binding periplasmic protein n=1 Tax=Lacibacterium aquatile TaxID=1168082 RepID=A0ABW5DWU4_9PROT
MRLCRGLVILALVFIGGPAKSQALSSDASLPVLAIVSGYPPYTDSTLPDGGLLAKVVKAALRAVDVKVQIVEMPGNRALYELGHGEINAAFPLARTDERERRFRFSDPLGALTMGAFVPSQAHGGWSGITAMNGKTACIPVGWPIPRVLVGAVEAGRVKRLEPNDLEACVRMLAAGRTDIVVNDPSVIWHIARTLKVERRIALAQDELMVSGHYLLVRRGDPKGEALLEAVNRGLTSIRLSGEYDMILKALGR